jgi:hypothetical protein
MGQIQTLPFVIGEANDGGSKCRLLHLGDFRKPDGDPTIFLE